MKFTVTTLLSLLFVGSLAQAANKAVAASAAKSAETVSVVLTKDNTVALNDAFYGETVAQLTKQAKELDSRTESSDPIYLVINSPGGSIDAGLELIENLSNMRRPVKTITLFSASMGFQTVQGLGERLVTRNGTLMSHKAKGGFYGEFPGQLDSRYGYYLKRITRLDEKAVERTQGKHTLKTYRDLIENEYWCDGKDCIEQGFADQLVSPSCDKSLEGKNMVTIFQDIFMGHTIELLAEYDACPLNTNALKYIIKIDGQLLFPENKPTETKKNETPSSLNTYNPFNSIFGGYGYNSSTSSTDAPKLTKEELFEINKRVEKYINAKQNREVIKGY